MRDFQLAEHVHACITPKGTVFLDLRRDAYSGLDACQSRALEAAVAGWPENTDAAPPDDSDEIITSLCESGVLVRHPTSGHAHCAQTYDEPNDELRAWRDMRPVKVRLRDVLTFFRALFIALVMIRCRPMTAVAARAQRLSTSTPDSIVDLERARELLTIYTYIRLFVFARRGRCLIDSLALQEFLAAHGVHVRWIVGVRARPFSAHCWLQYQESVLNGTPAFVRGFHVIFAT